MRWYRSSISVKVGLLLSLSLVILLFSHAKWARVSLLASFYSSRLLFLYQIIYVLHKCIYSHLRNYPNNHTKCYIHTAKNSSHLRMVSSEMWSWNERFHIIHSVETKLNWIIKVVSVVIEIQVPSTKSMWCSFILSWYWYYYYYASFLFWIGWMDDDEGKARHTFTRLSLLHPFILWPFFSLLLFHIIPKRLPLLFSQYHSKYAILWCNHNIEKAIKVVGHLDETQKLTQSLN